MCVAVIIPWRNGSFSARACQPTVGFTSTFPKIWINDHLDSIGMTIINLAILSVVEGFLLVITVKNLKMLQLPHDDKRTLILKTDTKKYLVIN